MTDFMGNRNMEEDMAEDRHLWGLGVDGRLLAEQILIIFIIIIIIIINYLWKRIEKKATK